MKYRAETMPHDSWFPIKFNEVYKQFGFEIQLWNSPQREAGLLEFPAHFAVLGAKVHVSLRALVLTDPRLIQLIT